MGRNLVWVTVLAFFASFGAQTGKRWLFFSALAGTLIFALILPTIFVVAGARARSMRLTSEERADFVFSNGRLCNPALGVSLADPGKIFHSEPEAQKSMNEGLRKISNNLAGWVWRADNGEVLIIQAAKGAASSSRVFTDFIDGVRKSLTSEKDLQIEKESSAMDLPPYSYHAAMIRSDGVRLDKVCISPITPEPASPVICATTLADTHEALQEMRSSIRFGACS